MARIKLSPSLCVNDAHKAIEFYVKSYGASEVERHTELNEIIDYAVLKVGDAEFMVSDKCHSKNRTNILKDLETSIVLHLSAENSEKLVRKAIDNGAELLNSKNTRSLGNSGGRIVDPFGHEWFISEKPQNTITKAMNGIYSDPYGKE